MKVWQGLEMGDMHRISWPIRRRPGILDLWQLESMLQHRPSLGWVCFHSASVGSGWLPWLEILLPWPIPNANANENANVDRLAMYIHCSRPKMPCSVPDFLAKMEGEDGSKKKTQSADRNAKQRTKFWSSAET